MHPWTLATLLTDGCFDDLSKGDPLSCGRSIGQVSHVGGDSDVGLSSGSERRRRTDAMSGLASAAGFGSEASRVGQ